MATLAVPAGAAGPVSVTVNGQPANLNPPPTERAGRVFVPLRGVFEQLGATVVYQNGTINATGRGHTVSLTIGSQQAVVDGQTQTVDVAPFIIGASTYVPLRFVSQALGASVNYDGANNIVAINTNGGGGGPAMPPSQVITPQPGPNSENGAITLVNERPARGSTASSNRPLIEAAFAGGQVDPNSVRIALDQLDVTNDSTRSPRGFTYAPRSPLRPGVHRVRVSGTDTNGQPFVRGWSFTSGTSEAMVNAVDNVRPRDGTTVGNQFVVSGHTIPGAHVTVQVGVSNSGSVRGIVGALLGGGGTNSATYSLTADGNGDFSTEVSISAPSGSQVLLAIDAVDPRTGATAPPIRETLSIR
jgi:hypothetical protein